MPTSTANYALQKPLVNNATDEDLWGDEINDDLDDIDTLLRAGITFASQVSQTSNFNADASISVKKFYPCNATSGALTSTIPLAATAGNGATVAIKKTDASANAVALARSGSDTFNGATSLSIGTQNGSYILISDGVSAWNSVGGIESPDASTTVKGIVELATAAEVLTGTNSTKAVTADALAGNKSLAAKGHYSQAGGFITQWGSVTASGSGTETFDTPFSTACYSVVGTPTTETNFTISSLTTTGFNYSFGTPGSRTFTYQAVGK